MHTPFKNATRIYGFDMSHAFYEYSTYILVDASIPCVFIFVGDILLTKCASRLFVTRNAFQGYPRTEVDPIWLNLALTNDKLEITSFCYLNKQPCERWLYNSERSS